MREYVVCICFSILFCIGVNLLVPSPKYNGIIRIVCGIFILQTMLIPVKNIISSDINARIPEEIFNFDKDFGSFSKQSKEHMDRALVNNSRLAMENQIQREIKGIYAGKVEITETKEGLTAYVESADEGYSKAKEYIEKTYGIKTVLR